MKILIYLLVMFISFNSYATKVVYVDEVVLNKKLELALDYMNKLKKDKALELVDQVIVKRPNSYKPYLTKAQIYVKLGYGVDKDLALKNVEKAILFNNKVKEAYYYRSIIKTMYPNKKTESLKDLKKAISLDNRYIEAYEKMAQLRSELKDYSGAIETYSTLINITEPNYKSKAEYFYGRGSAYSHLSDKIKAIKNYSKAIKLDKKAIYYFSRAVARIEVNDYDGCIYDSKISKELYLDEPKTIFSNFDGYKESLKMINTCKKLQRLQEQVDSFY